MRFASACAPREPELEMFFSLLLGLLLNFICCDARNIFVVGGSNFMGKLFVARSAKRGDHVWMLNRGLSAPGFMQNEPNVRLVKADRFNAITIIVDERFAILG